ncbi:Zinc finger protein ZFAT, partial [Armadillidium nasatum]
MDIKSEIEIKEEFLEDSEDYKNNDQRFEHNSKLEEIQDKKFCPNIDVKEEREIVDESLDFKVEYAKNGEQYEQISGADKSQTSTSDVAHGDKDSNLKEKSNLRKGIRTSRRHSQRIENNDFNKLSRTRNANLKCKDAQKSYLKSHRIKKFTCSHCNYGCNYKGNLKSHMLTHANLKLFKCSHCSYQCNHKGNLKSHLLSHAN